MHDALIGVVLRGPTNEIEKIIRDLERNKNIRLIYVRHANPGSFLLVVETQRAKGGRLCHERPTPR